ncbi:hypothetical protein [Micromonospora maritima]|uniref:hypothetical protein n=1 Tax=Micromonospora maritima TaxID=986711 RepID=UPI00157DB8A3|nr:hypothetical protein [Micromonospora maritima]
MTTSCEGCGRSFEAKRSSARFCGATCRKRVSRRPAGLPPAEPVDASSGESDLVTSVRLELVAARRLDTVLGQQALVLAARLDVPDTGSAVAALNKELRATMEAALKGAEESGDSVDELKARRERRRGA